MSYHHLDWKILKAGEAGSPDLWILRPPGHIAEDARRLAGHPRIQPPVQGTLIKKEIKFSSYLRKLREIGCKLICD